MDYKTFIESVGEETVGLLEDMSIKRNTTKNKDQHLKQLFNFGNILNIQIHNEVKSTQQQDKEEERGKEEKV